MSLHVFLRYLLGALLVLTAGAASGQASSALISRATELRQQRRDAASAALELDAAFGAAGANLVSALAQAGYLASEIGRAAEAQPRLLPVQSLVQGLVTVAGRTDRAALTDLIRAMPSRHVELVRGLRGVVSDVDVALAEVAAGSTPAQVAAVCKAAGHTAQATVKALVGAFSMISPATVFDALRAAPFDLVTVNHALKLEAQLQPAEALQLMESRQLPSDSTAYALVKVHALTAASAQSVLMIYKASLTTALLIVAVAEAVVTNPNTPLPSLWIVASTAGHVLVQVVKVVLFVGYQAPEVLQLLASYGMKADAAIRTALPAGIDPPTIGRMLKVDYSQTLDNAVLTLKVAGVVAALVVDIVVEAYTPTPDKVASALLKASYDGQAVIQALVNVMGLTLAQAGVAVAAFKP